ncbi:hypothetical protein Hanom_Chr00s000980g01670911 [Helianthus anomalus]
MDSKVVLEDQVKDLKEDVRMYKLQVIELEDDHSRIVRKWETYLIISWIFFCVVCLGICH